MAQDRRSPADKAADQEQSPPFNPDPDLIDHMEDNQRLVRRWRNAADRDRADALQRRGQNGRENGD